jgi:hypothetical protein
VNTQTADTMKNLRYQLEKGSAKHRCPACQRPKEYKRYIDTETGQLLPEQYGFCNRRAKCGYELNPYTDGYKPVGQSWQQIERHVQRTVSKPLPLSKKVYVPDEILVHLEQNHRANNSFLTGVKNCVPDMPDSLINQAAVLYRIGTVKAGYLQNGCCFPFIDSRQRVHSIQVKTFSERAKTLKTGFIHTLLKDTPKYKDWFNEYDKQELKTGCFFGAHLLKQFPDNPIALVESPKNAIIGTLFFGLPNESPDNYLWLATYSISTLKPDRAKELRGRKVILFPDRGAMNQWQADMNLLVKQMPDTVFEISDLMESETAQSICPADGADIADLLMKFSWQAFTGNNSPTATRENCESENKLFSAPVKQERFVINGKIYANENEALLAYFGVSPANGLP